MNITVYIPGNYPEKKIIIPKLVHGKNVVSITTGNEDVSACDAMITKNQDVILGIKTADCAPICFTSSDMIGIAHVGWRGLTEGLLQKMVNMFPIHTEIYIGPHMHVFEIKKDTCYDLLMQAGLRHHIQEKDGILEFHFKDALLEIVPSAVCDPRNTYTDITLPSYRRDKTQERLLTVINF